MGVVDSCVPRKEVLEGEITDAIFAADFGHLISDQAPPVYAEPDIFFQNTHPAERLKTVVRRVFERLADTSEVGATIRLSTGFGGGKTHALMALWHLGNNIGDHTLGTELLAAAGRPKKIKVVGIDAGKGGVPIFATHEKTQVRSLWGEFFLLLHGKQGLAQLGAADDAEASPDEEMIRQALPEGPLLILLDELVIYMARLSDRGMGNVLGFINSLAAIAASRPQTVLLVTDPAEQAAYGAQAQALNGQLESAAAQLAEVQARRVTDFDPIGDEVARVITRRLFESVDPDAAQKISAQFFELFKRVNEESQGLLPQHALTVDYAEEIPLSYPFHPRMLETAQDRLGAMPDFQRSRGVLRLFAKIIRSVWSRDLELDLITAGDLDWGDGDIEAELLGRLDRERFKAAVHADLKGHAKELDARSPGGIHQRVASALLLESLPLLGSSGLDPAEMTLAILRLDEAGQEPSEALDHLVGVCWHTYPTESGRAFQFRYEPNVLKQIEEHLADIPFEDGRARVRSEVQGYFQGPSFRLAAWPESPAHVQESAQLQLALCETEDLAERVCQFADDRDPQSPMPRSFRNSILAITASTAGFSEAVERGRRLLAAERIQSEHRTGESSALVREQLRRIVPELMKRFQVQARRAFDRVQLSEGNMYPMEEQYQVSDEELLKSPRGQAGLLRFLEDKKLIYPAGSHLDARRFLDKVLPGATPLVDNQDVWTGKAVHERFLAAPGLRLVKDAGVVRQTIRECVTGGSLVVRLTDGRAYDREGVVSQQGEMRKRTPGAVLPEAFSLDDELLLALPEASAVADWLRTEDKEKKENGDGDEPIVVLPGPSGPVTLHDWDAILEATVRRPLHHLRLGVDSHVDASQLLALIQPLGAQDVTLSVSASGEAKGKGFLSFQAEDVKPTHPLKPIELARNVLNSLVEGGSFDASLKLEFGGTTDQGLVSKLRSLREQAPESTRVEASLGPEEEGYA